MAGLGILPHQLASKHEEEARMRAAMNPDAVLAQMGGNPIVDLLVRFLMETEQGQAGRRLGQPSPSPTPENRMRSQGGPIQANTPKRIASERERIYSQIP